MNKNEKIRKQVSKKFGDVLARYQTTESALLNNYVKNNKRVLFYIYRKIEATKIINFY